MMGMHEDPPECVLQVLHQVDVKTGCGNDLGAFPHDPMRYPLAIEWMTPVEKTLSERHRWITGQHLFVEDEMQLVHRLEGLLGRSTRVDVFDVGRHDPSRLEIAGQSCG